MLTEHNMKKDELEKFNLENFLITVALLLQVEGW